MSSQAIFTLSSLHLIAYEVNQEPNSLPTGSAQRDPSCDLCFFQTILRSGLWIPSRLMKTGDPFFASCALCASGPASARCACRAGHLIGASSPAEEPEEGRKGQRYRREVDFGPGLAGLAYQNFLTTYAGRIESNGSMVFNHSRLPLIKIKGTYVALIDTKGSRRLLHPNFSTKFRGHLACASLKLEVQL